MARSNLVIAGLLITLATYTSAQDSASNYTITASTCAAPTAFNQCVSPIDSFLASCLAQAGNDQGKILACSCVGTLKYLNCAMANCWNVVYGCEYQTIANIYDSVCAAPVPFFPAPDNAPGGCSCNLGYVLYNNTNAALEYKDCISSDVTQNDGCACCWQATGYAALYDICPNTQPALAAGIPNADGIYDVTDPSLKQGECASYFAKYDCSSLGFTGLGIPFMTSYNSATIGKSTLFNTNTKTLSSPVSGATFTWTNLGLPYTIVAASANARAASGSSASSRVTGTSAAATGVSGSGSSSAPAATTSANGGHRSSDSPLLIGLITAMAILLHMDY